MGNAVLHAKRADGKVDHHPAMPYLDGVGEGHGHSAQADEQC